MSSRNCVVVGADEGTNIVLHLVWQTKIVPREVSSHSYKQAKEFEYATQVIIC